MRKQSLWGRIEVLESQVIVILALLPTSAPLEPKVQFQIVFALPPPPTPLLLLGVWSGWHDQKHRRDMAYDCEWVVCLLGSSLNRRIICLSLHKAALSDFIVVVPFHRPERGFVGVETRSACKTG